MIKITVYTRPNCSECERIKALLTQSKIPFETINMEKLDEASKFILKTEARKNRQISMPLIYVNNSFMHLTEFEERYL